MGSHFVFKQFVVIIIILFIIVKKPIARLVISFISIHFSLLSIYLTSLLLFIIGLSFLLILRILFIFNPESIKAIIIIAYLKNLIICEYFSSQQAGLAINVN